MPKIFQCSQDAHVTVAFFEQPPAAMIVDGHVLGVWLQVHDAPRNEDSVEFLDDDIELCVGVEVGFALVDRAEGGLHLCYGNEHIMGAVRTCHSLTNNHALEVGCGVDVFMMEAIHLDVIDGTWLEETSCGLFEAG